MTDTSVIKTEIEILSETNIPRLNKFIVESGAKATENHTMFCLGVWKMYFIKPWTVAPLQLEDMEITSWYDYRMWLAGKVKGVYSPSSIDNAAKRIQFLYDKKVEWADIINAIANYPVAIDDLRAGKDPKTPMPQLLSDLASLPNPTEARKRVAGELGTPFCICSGFETESDAAIFSILEYVGEELISEFEIVVANYNELTDAQKSWLKKEAMKLRWMDKS